LPLFLTKKEVFEWLKIGKKTIDIRKGTPQRGNIAVFQSGPHTLRLKIVKKETGRLTDIVQLDNYQLVIPSAEGMGDAIVYLRRLYAAYDGFFTAYYIAPLKS
jgi:ASC-1-like (ASCH) protein